MSIVNLIILGVMPFVTIIVFIVGMFYRFRTWSRLKKPIMTLFPRSSDSTLVNVLKETLLFRGLFRTDKLFWGGAWIFHVLLAFIFVGHVRVFTDFPALWAAIGWTKENVDLMSATTGGAAGVVILIMTLYLLSRRFSLKRVKEITSVGDYLAILLIIGILITGNMMRFGEHFDLNLTRTYFASLFTLSSISSPQNNMFLLHFFLAQLLIIYIPFSKIMHFGGIFFSQTVLRRV